jgi:hypothetical protein
MTVAVISSGLFVLRLMLSRCVNLPTLDGKRYDGQHWRARKWLGVCNVGWLAWLENDSYSGRRCAVPYTLFMSVTGGSYATTTAPDICPSAAVANVVRDHMFRGREHLLPKLTCLVLHCEQGGSADLER